MAFLLGGELEQRPTVGIAQPVFRRTEQNHRARIEDAQRGCHGFSKLSKHLFWKGGGGGQLQPSSKTLSLTVETSNLILKIVQDGV